MLLLLKLKDLKYKKNEIYNYFQDFLMIMLIIYNIIIYMSRFAIYDRVTVTSSCPEYDKEYNTQSKQGTIVSNYAQMQKYFK